MFDLTGKVVLLTGATGGIGKSIAKRMSENGARLILSGTKKNIPKNPVDTRYGMLSIDFLANIGDKPQPKEQTTALTSALIIYSNNLFYFYLKL